MTTSTTTTKIVSCAVCQAPTKITRLLELPSNTNLEVCMPCAHAQHTSYIGHCHICGKIQDGMWGK